MEMLEQGTPSRQAFAGVYGKTLEAVERDLKAYLRRGYFATRIAFVQAQSANAAAVEPAAMFDVNLALLDLASRLGKTAETRAGLQRLMREDPRRPEPHVTLGYLLVRNNREAEAFHSFETAVNLGSRDAQMLWDYGRLAAATEPVQAMRVLKLLLAGQPSRADARLELAGIQMSRGWFKDAVVTLEPVPEVAPGDAHRLYQILTMAHLELGNRAVALGHARRWLESAQDNSQRTNAGRMVHFLEESGP
jgi:Tfp pilus assembly protein PilF